MRQQGEAGSLVTLICDSGDRYSATYFNDEWLKAQKIDISGWRSRIETFLDSGEGTLLDVCQKDRAGNV
jgi:cysteine synthase A